MSNESELGKGLFGYRKSAVEQIMSDRDQMLRQAEGRVRAAESKVAELETELNAMQDRNARMDQQLERLRLQLDEFASRTQPGQSPAPVWTEPQTTEAVPPEPAPVDAPYTELSDSAPEAEASYAEPTYAPAEPQPVFDVPVPEAEPLAAENAWDEPSSWDETEPVAGAPYQELSQEPESPAADVPDVAYASEDRYGYGDMGAMIVTEDTAEPQPSEAWEGWTPESESYEPVPEAESYEPVPESPVYEPSFEAQIPMAVADEPAPEFAEPEAEVPVVEAVREEPAPKEEAPPVDDLTQRFLNDELAQILRAAEESAARIVERARTTTDQQIEESNRLWHDVQAEVARFAAWRDEVEPVIHAVQSKVDDVRTYIDEVPERIRQALAPVADSISSIDGDLADLAARATPPLLLTPSGVAGPAADTRHDEEPQGTDVHDAYGWIPEPDESPDASGEGGSEPESMDDQEYDVPFGEGWAEVTEHPGDEGDHSFGASAG
jgi:hypothetical protein